MLRSTAPPPLFMKTDFAKSRARRDFASVKELVVTVRAEVFGNPNHMA